MQLVESELRRLARSYLRRESPGHSVQTDMLVDDAFLRLTGKKNISWQSRAHFFGIAAKVMRQILVEHARKRTALKRGGNERHVTFDEALDARKPGIPLVDVLAIHEALIRLESLSPRQSEIVELRVFAGLTIEEAAVVAGVAPTTVKSEWRAAKAWLRRELGDGGSSV